MLVSRGEAHGALTLKGTCLPIPQDGVELGPWAGSDPARPAPLLDPSQKRGMPSGPALPPVLPTGQEDGQQIEGEKYAQAKEHTTNIGLRCCGGAERKMSTSDLPRMLVMAHKGPTG